MKHIGTFSLFLALVLSVSAKSDFRFYVFDQTKTDQVDYELVHDIVFQPFSENVWFVYYIEYRVHGIAAEEFTYQTELFRDYISTEDFERFMERVRSVPTTGLDNQPELEDGETSGWIDIDEKSYDVSARPNSEIRRVWRQALDELLAIYAPKEKRKIETFRLFGDFIDPVDLELDTLLLDPAKYDGRRVRISGFYHGEFEGSSFAPSKNDIYNFKRALWLGKTSTFAAKEHVPYLNDQYITVEATFELGPGGHMGAWLGELVRVTSIERTEEKQNQSSHTTPASAPR